MDNKIVTARFATDDNYANVYDVYQWDYGQILRIEGLKLPNMVEIHFSLQETSGEAKTRIGVTKDSATDVVIPDSFLENNGIGDNYKIFAWIYIADKDSGSTEYKITIHIKARAKPEITHGGQDGEMFQEAVEAVRDAAARASESEKQAERWAVGRVDVPGAETDNSKFYSEESKKNAQQTTKDKEAVEELVKKTENIGQLAEDVKTNAQKASESAKNAENSAANASVSEKNAKTSESNASTSETNAKASETNAKASEQAVEESKQAVDKAVADFGQAVTDASATLKAEKDAHVKAITTAGTTETKRVTDEATKQVQTVQSIGTQETEKVTAEGTKQVTLVKTEGEKHLASVQTAAQEIIADREQINANKAGVAKLKEDIAILEAWNKQLQDALISQKAITTNNSIKVTNSAKLPIAKLSVFGKSEQVQTTGAQLLNYYKLAELSPQYYAIEQGELKVKGSNNAAWTSVPEYGTLAAGTYTISGNNVEIRDASKNTVIATCIGDTFSKFTLNENTAIKMKVGYGLDKYPVIMKAMLNKGDSKKPYEPYTGGKPSPSIEYPQEITNCGEDGTINLEITGDNVEPQTLTIPTTNSLLGLKAETGGNYTDETGQQWITDEIDLARGKYVQRIRKIVLDGNIDTKHVGQHENGTKYLGITLQEKDYTLKASNMLCTRYIRAEWTNKNGYVYSAKKDAVFITDNRFTDSETTKKIIDEEKPVIIYPLLTPIETDLPSETISAFEQLHTNYPNTIVSNNADAGMELTYTVDTQSYIDDKIAEVSKAIL